MFVPLIFAAVQVLAFVSAVSATSRTSPPSGAVIVRAGTTTSGEFADVGTAVNSLPDDSSTQIVFIYPGTYEGQVNISRTGPTTLYGYTSDVMDFNQNTAILAHSATGPGAGSDDLSGTIRIHSDNVALYNLDIRNDFGVSRTDGQAIAISNYGSKFGAYACRFLSYQDTLYANEGTQVYLKSYIEGGVDYIFGARGQAYFESNVIASKGAGTVTASGRDTDTNVNIFVFNYNQLVASSDAFTNVTGNVYFGRPWRDYARVIFKNTYVTNVLNKNVWSVWSSSSPQTDFVLFADYNTTGPGATGLTRPSFATALSSTDAASYSIGSVVGSDYLTWVDTDYLLPSSLQ